ncbi:hypothetical protein TNCV_4168431 [Trichonephila clavipes]|nr:hypothetical protein TNCV_4168431 [Trichonephila clavipes]
MPAMIRYLNHMATAAPPAGVEPATLGLRSDYATSKPQKTERTELDCSIVLLEEFIVVDDDKVFTAPILAHKDILELIRSSKSIIGADSDYENEMNNVAPLFLHHH